MKSPVILGTSPRESEYLGIKETVALFEIMKAKYNIPAFLNLDHAKDLKSIKEAIDYGYSCVHFDGSNLNFKKNIECVKKIVKYAHKKGVLVEGEIGIIGTESSKIYKKKFKIEKKNLTNPEEAEKFIKETGVDSLAVSIGNFHGIQAIGKNPPLHLKRLEEIRKVTEKTFLVLHGGSGIRKKDIKEAIKLGIVKININTDLRLAFAKGLMKNFSKGKIKQLAPYKYLPFAINEVQKKVEEKIKLFKSNNKI